MNIPKSKESVGKVVLAISSTTAIFMGVMLYDSNVKLHKMESKLGKTQIVIEHQQNNYKQLEQKFLSVESDNKKLSSDNNELSKRQGELMSQINQLQDKNKSLNDEVQANPFTKMTVEASGYSLVGDSQGSDGNPWTATGSYPRANHTVAVDSSLIPLGSEIYIPSTGQHYIAEDVGGAIKGNRIDIYFNTGDEARQWGRQTVEIFIKTNR